MDDVETDVPFSVVEVRNHVNETCIARVQHNYFDRVAKQFKNSMNEHVGLGLQHEIAPRVWYSTDRVVAFHVFKGHIVRAVDENVRL